MKISACIITKNEEHNLPRLLNSIKGKFDEIILVDTGSTDRTIEIAKEYGCKVYEKEWNGFADARNYAVSKASGDWIWHFDADFELEDKEFKRFQYILNLINGNDIFDGINVNYKNLGISGEIKSISSTMHIHRNDKNLIWVGKVHERIMHKKKKEVITPPYTVYVKHYGYAEASVQKEKAKRNLNLLFEELKSIDKNDTEYLVKLFYLIQSYAALSSFDSENLEKVIRYSDEFFSLYKAEKFPFLKDSVFVKHIYVYTAHAYIKLGKLENAKEILEKGLENYPDYPDLVYLLSLIYKTKNDMDNALENLLKFIYLSDKISSNPTALSSVVSDFITLIDSLLLDLENFENKSKFIETAYKYWKDVKGKNTALAYYFLLKGIDEKKANSILKKFVKKYSSELLSIEYLNTLSTIDEKIDYLKKEINQNPNALRLNLEIGKLYYNLKNYENAFRYINSYFKKSSDSSVLPLLIKSLENLGYKEEAKQLLQKIEKN